MLKPKTYANTRRRQGGRIGVAARSRRLSLTVPVAMFEAIKQRAVENRRGLGGEAAMIIAAALAAKESAA